MELFTINIMKLLDEKSTISLLYEFNNNYYNGTFFNIKSAEIKPFWGQFYKYNESDPCYWYTYPGTEEAQLVQDAEVWVSRFGIGFNTGEIDKIPCQN